MQARQQGLAVEEVKDAVVLGFHNSDAKIDRDLKNTLELQTLKLVDEVQYFPILEKTSEQELLISSYKRFVLARCQGAFTQMQI